MSKYHLNQGLNHVGSYQVSGSPFIYRANATTTEETIKFPRVSKSVHVKNCGTSDITISFPSTPTNEIVISSYESIEMPIKAAGVTVKTSSGTVEFQIYASLTSIPLQRIDGITV